MKRFAAPTVVLAGTFVLGVLAGSNYPIQQKVTNGVKHWLAVYHRGAGQAERAARLLYSGDDIEFIDNFHPDVFKTDPAALIRIDSADIAKETRQALRRYIWKNASGEAASLPIQVEHDFQDPRYADLQNLEGIDRISLEDPMGFDSVVYGFRPRDEIAGIVFYHQGHGGDFVLGKPIIQRLLSRNYLVFGFAMPALGLNSRPEIDHPRFGKIDFAGSPGYGQRKHNLIHYLDSDSYSGLRLFMDPLATMLDYAEREYRVSDVIMIGLSGGGWTTQVLAALDSRVSYSYPVAGALPLYLRMVPPNQPLSDFEFSNVTDFYRIANYLDLFVLAASGEGRRQVQIVNVYDPVFSRGRGSETYVGPVQDAVASTGSGSFDVLFDASHAEHAISDHAIEFILKDIEVRVKAPTGN